MKSPDTLRKKLKRQWNNGELREKRLLDHHQWPLIQPIGKPTAQQMTNRITDVRKHIAEWRKIRIGEVEWQAINYRSTAEAVQLPINWNLHSADQWIDGLNDTVIRQEYQLLTAVMRTTDQAFHPLLIRQRQQLLSRSAEESILACQIAGQLEANCAAGKPLRALSIAGCDSKFFERNRSLLIKLLEVRFGTPISEQGLESFLGALDESEHWLLVAPLNEGLLPFQQQRIRSSELTQTPLPGSHLLIIENERSFYQLPRLPGTIAILGAGLNLNWLQAEWISQKKIGYWGDIDSWGLTMLATARGYQPGLAPLLMDQDTFQTYAEQSAVAEPVIAGENPPNGLSEQEAALYQLLIGLKKGRLEQEFIAAKRVKQVMALWYAS